LVGEVKKKKLVPTLHSGAGDWGRELRRGVSIPLGRSDFGAPPGLGPTAAPARKRPRNAEGKANKGEGTVRDVSSEL